MNIEFASQEEDYKKFVKKIKKFYRVELPGTWSSLSRDIRETTEKEMRQFLFKVTLDKNKIKKMDRPSFEEHYKAYSNPDYDPK